MDFNRKGFLSAAPFNSFYYQCNVTSVSLAAKTDPTGTGLLLDAGSLRLGQCPPSSTSALWGYVVFEYGLQDCGFSRLISGRTLEYFADLAYSPSGSSVGQFSQPFAERINCTSYRGAQDPSPSPFTQVVFQVSGSGTLVFHAQLMKDDFSGPTDLKTFLLGSPIPVELSVVTSLHQALQIYVDECTAATTADLSTATQTYSLIRNHGCFLDGKEAASTFLARPSPDVIRLSFQTLRFVALDTDIFLHFQVVVWDPKILTDPSRKACSYLKASSRWELLDDPTHGSVCSCCDSVCKPLDSRRKRNIKGGEEEDPGLVHTVVLGPLRVRSPSASGSYEWDRNVSQSVATKPGLAVPPAVAALLLEIAALVLVCVGVAMYSRTGKKTSMETQATSLVDSEESEPQEKS
ncbi:zona pellucida sperm-binding protein 3-like [Ascaphus truei]|uniref:zona pellucida sperm-binding protein 3-like n=1 Tax=Ascaphus truei TaxID=8439 RepID=UPI003F5A34B5